MTDVNVLLERAELLLDQGRFKDAEVNIVQVLQQEPNHDYAMALLARCFINSKQLDKGIDAAQQAIALNPAHDFYFYLLGFAYYQKEQMLPALESLQQAISLNPYYAEYYGLSAHVLLFQKKFEEALNKANEGLALDAESVICLNARSIALNKLKRTEEAIATMQNALAQDPDNDITHATVGWNFLEKGKHKQAEKHFLEALRINPNQASAKSGLKESLKSKIPPYRWLLQYSFWIQNSGRKLQRVLPIALYIVFRVLIGLFNSNESTSGLAWILGGIYLLIVVLSWSLNSIANFFLFFHPLGKHALTTTERWSAISVMTVLVTGLAALGIASFTPIGEGPEYGGQLFLAGLVLISLALPFGIMEFPIQWKSQTRGELYTKLLLALGVISLLSIVLLPAVSSVLLIIYAVAFLIYNWTGIGK